jgi:hypothetical protein
VRYYHTTDAASRILEEGFRDDSGSYGLATFTLKGVFISDEPLDDNEGAIGDGVLELDLPDDLDIGEYELIEEGKGYREWCVPARILNKYPMRILTEEEVDSIAWER